jgi:hypothetical protein
MGFVGPLGERLITGWQGPIAARMREQELADDLIREYGRLSASDTPTVGETLRLAQLEATVQQVSALHNALEDEAGSRGGVGAAETYAMHRQLDQLLIQARQGLN